MIVTIANFFGTLIRLIYDLVGNNYALSIIIFTLLTKLILFPLFLKQIKSTEQINKIGPEDKKIREKYKNDKQKMTEEITKLYSENKINPLGGCLPLIIQIPIVIAMFIIVKQPLTYIVQLPSEDIKTYTQEIMQKQEVSQNDMNNNEIIIANKYKIIDMQLGKINLGEVPSDVFSNDPLKRSSKLSLIIPVLTVIFSIIQFRQSQKGSMMTEEQKEMQKTNALMLPILSGVFAYMMPLALGLYWLIGNIIQIIQQIVVNKFVLKKTNNSDQN